MRGNVRCHKPGTFQKCANTAGSAWWPALQKAFQSDLVTGGPTALFIKTSLRAGNHQNGPLAHSCSTQREHGGEGQEGMNLTSSRFKFFYEISRFKSLIWQHWLYDYASLYIPICTVNAKVGSYLMGL